MLCVGGVSGAVWTPTSHGSMSWSLRPVGPTVSTGPSSGAARRRRGADRSGQRGRVGRSGYGRRRSRDRSRRWYSRADLTPVSSPGSSGSRPRRLREPAAEPGGRPNWPSTHHVADALRDTADVAPGQYENARIDDLEQEPPCPVNASLPDPVGELREEPPTRAGRGREGEGGGGGGGRGTSALWRGGGEREGGEGGGGGGGGEGGGRVGWRELGADRSRTPATCTIDSRLPPRSASGSKGCAVRWLRLGTLPRWSLSIGWRVMTCARACRSSRGRPLLGIPRSRARVDRRRSRPHGCVGVGGCRDNDPQVLLSSVAQALDGVRPDRRAGVRRGGVPTSSVPAPLVSRVGAAFAAMTAPSPADVGLGSVCPLIIGPRSNEAGIGRLGSQP